MGSREASPHEGAATLLAAYRQVQAAADALKGQMADWANLEDRIRQNIAKVPTVVTLNVGGTTFQAFKDTFLRVEGSYFHALLGSGAWAPDSPGNAYFLDLDPDIFRHVFRFLRTGTLSTDRLTQLERCDLKSMLEYLKLDEASEATIVREWDPAMHAPEIGLSNDLRTIERLKADDGIYKGAVAKSPVVGALRLRVACIPKNFCIGLGSKSKCDVSSVSTVLQFYRLYSDGRFFNKAKQVACDLPQLKAGDVVKVDRSGSYVGLTVSDRPTCQIKLMNASEELYPKVFMSGPGTKVTILDATEA